jgi:NADH:ubiquinone oxidoreductase subunit 6 (subunit J)
VAGRATPSVTRERAWRRLVLGRVGIAAGIVLALLVVVALASTASGPVAGEATGDARAPSRAFLDYAVTIGLVAVAAMTAALAYLLRPSARWKETDSRAPLHLLPLLIALTILVGGCVVIGYAFRGDLRARPPAPGVRERSSGVSDTAVAPASYEPQFRWPVVVAAATLAVAAVVAVYVVRRRGRRRVASSPHELVTELRSMLDLALDDLRAEQDPRRAVIAAYARMERALAAFGYARRAFEAPFEYLARVGPTLAASVPAARTLVFELTHLFERAKFSPHEIDARMQDEAIHTLTQLRDELVALQEEHAPAAA